jgi:hypothetical protein
MERPMPPFSGEVGPYIPPLAGELRPPTMPPVQSYEPRRVGARADTTPRPPQFEPLLPPLALAVGVLGLLVLGGAALVIFGAVAP